MKYDKLGNTDIEVSKICLGTMTWGEQNTEAEAHEQMDYALAQGVNFWDTAELYAVPPKAENNGKTEEYIGTWFKKTGRRKEVVLATKITGPRPGVSFIREDLRFTEKQLNLALEGSLKRLQTDYVDLYQLHWPERETNCFGKLDYVHNPEDSWKENFETVIGVLDGFVKEGKIRHYGVSNETPWGVMKQLQTSDAKGLIRAQSIQNPYSLLNRSFEVGLAEIAIREKVGLLAYSPMAFGLLSGKYHDGTATERDRINKYKGLSRYNAKNTWEAAARYIQIAKDYGITPAQFSLAFINTRPFLVSNIIGATTMAQLKENIESIHIEFTDEMLGEVNKVHKVYSNPAP